MINAEFLKDFRTCLGYQILLGQMRGYRGSVGRNARGKNTWSLLNVLDRKKVFRRYFSESGLPEAFDSI